MASSFPLDEIPLFPLHTVLFPGGRLPLRIFEPRYLRMVSDCLKHGAGFGVVLISKGQETGAVPETFQVGTRASIVDWDQGEDGFLAVTVLGSERFHIIKGRVGEQGLLHATVEPLPPPLDDALPPMFRPQAQLLQELLARVGDEHHARESRFDQASWVGYRLTELLPLNLTHKQRLLEMADPLARLDALGGLIRALGEQSRPDTD